MDKKAKTALLKKVEAKLDDINGEAEHHGDTLSLILRRNYLEQIVHQLGLLPNVRKTWTAEDYIRRAFEDVEEWTLDVLYEETRDVEEQIGTFRDK